MSCYDQKEFSWESNFVQKRQPKRWTLSNEGALINEADEGSYKNNRRLSNRKFLVHLTMGCYIAFRVV